MASAETPNVPTTEALALSASVFASSVSSWLPANFGHKVPAADAEKEWQALLRSAGEGKDRLGLGHPALNAPKVGGGGYKGGLQGLERSLKNGKRRQGEEEKERGGKPSADAQGDEVESEEEESRASMVGKRKRQGMVDPLGGKKKKKAAATGTGTNGAAVATSGETSAQASPAMAETAQANEATPAPTTDKQVEQVEAAPATPAKTPSKANPNSPVNTKDTPKPSTIASLASCPLPSDSQQVNPSAQNSPVKSKSAIKREKKKLAKARKALEQEQQSSLS
ncbi:uncharacterized protein MKK02DRAFT_31448 [Dioszegia hungarica]|uniref:Uncharacterized protein n=1 Tax=Dioszegia hungarica TaxID=4972 RepID=A0AA38LV39_9TREE|nr:uncharacterized protein MKK02DRAFT_31448 [Dioszegia hungarica]KAI9637902.1 hypothetical protein MKK02DRAFT_31448 [Dioszegia hungarica]